MRINSVAAAMLCCLAMFTGCEGKAPLPEGGPGVVTVQGRLPYVESVKFPDKIAAGLPFEVQVNVSAALFQDALRVDARGHEDGSVTGLIIPRFQLENGFQLETWLYESSSEKPLVDSIVFELPALPAGDYMVRLSSADDASRGGLEREVMITPYKGPFDFTSVSYREFPFHVESPE